MLGMKKTLIVVYKDEMLVNQLKKLVESHDDIDADNIVGTADDSINIVSWDEKVWLANKKAGNIKDKVLFLGDIKGTEKLIPVVDNVFDKYGVRFGWAGNQAILYADVAALADKTVYVEFFNELSECPIPEMLKKAVVMDAENGAVDVVDTTTEIGTDVDVEEKRKFSHIFNKAKTVIAVGTDAVEKASVVVKEKTEDILRDKNLEKRQMMFYGVVNMYNHGLEQFMNN